MQFGGIQLQQAIQSTEEQDGDDDGEVTNEGTELEHMQEEQRRGHCGTDMEVYRLMQVQIFAAGRTDANTEAMMGRQCRSLDLSCCLTFVGK